MYPTLWLGKSFNPVYFIIRYWVYLVVFFEFWAKCEKQDDWFLLNVNFFHKVKQTKNHKQNHCYIGNVCIRLVSLWLQFRRKKKLQPEQGEIWIYRKKLIQSLSQKYLQGFPVFRGIWKQEFIWTHYQNTGVLKVRDTALSDQSTWMPFTICCAWSQTT